MRLLPNRPMRAFLPVIWGIFAALQIASAPAAAADLQQWLSTPIWYAQFEVEFRVAHKDTAVVEGVTRITHIDMDRTFSAMWPVDIRSDGPSMVLGTSMLSGGADGSKPSLADQQKMMEGIFARMNTAANWMSSGGALAVDPDASFEESQAATEAGMKAAMGPARLEYLRVDIGLGCVNEMGDKFDMITRTTHTGSGQVLAGGGQGITFEIDAAAKTYALILPIGFNDMGTMMKIVTTTQIGIDVPKPDITKDSSEVGLGLYPSNVELDDLKNLQAGMAIIRGDIDPTATKITGERTMGAHFDDGNKLVHGMMTFRYTLTTTPPPAQGK